MGCAGSTTQASPKAQEDDSSDGKWTKVCVDRPGSDAGEPPTVSYSTHTAATAKPSPEAKDDGDGTSTSTRDGGPDRMSHAEPLTEEKAEAVTNESPPRSANDNPLLPPSKRKGHFELPLDQLEFEKEEEKEQVPSLGSRPDHAASHSYKPLHFTTSSTGNMQLLSPSSSDKKKHSPPGVTTVSSSSPSSDSPSKASAGLVKFEASALRKNTVVDPIYRVDNDRGVTTSTAHVAVLGRVELEEEKPPRKKDRSRFIHPSQLRSSSPQQLSYFPVALDSPQAKGKVTGGEGEYLFDEKSDEGITTGIASSACTPRHGHSVVSATSLTLSSRTCEEELARHHHRQCVLIEELKQKSWAMRCAPSKHQLEFPPNENFMAKKCRKKIGRWIDASHPSSITTPVYTVVAEESSMSLVDSSSLSFASAEVLSKGDGGNKASALRSSPKQQHRGGVKTSTRVAISPRSAALWKIQENELETDRCSTPQGGFAPSVNVVLGVSFTDDRTYLMGESER